MIPFDDIIRNLNIKLARFNSLIKRFRSAIHSGKTEDNRGSDVSYLMSFLHPLFRKSRRFLNDGRVPSRSQDVAVKTKTLLAPI